MAKLTSDGPIITTDNFQLLERVYLDQSAINDLNTYRNWNMFGLQAESIYDDGGDRKGGFATEEEFIKQTFFTHYKSEHDYPGVKSLFNNSHAVAWGQGDDGLGGYRIPTNTPLLDSVRVRQAIRDRGGCSIAELVEASKAGHMGRAIYNYSDFMYCKYLGQMSNNYLITLRRFPYPCGDHINFTDPIEKGHEKSNHHLPDTGRLVTWMGTPGNDIQEILKYEVLMPYKEMQSQIHEVNGTAEQGGILGAICNATSSSYSAKVLLGRGGENSLSLMSGMLGSTGKFIAGPPDTSWLYHRDMSKAYGPADVIAKTHIRSGGEDGGLKFEQNINLTFDYELRSYDGINPKTAMIDLISNILAVTFTDGKFWGGGYHANGPSQSSLFTNLPIFKLGAPGHALSFNTLKDAVSGSIGQIAAAANNGKPISGIGDLISMAMNLLSNAGNMLVGGALNALGRPQKQGMDSLLKNDPVGLWHLTIGNPKHPIMTMGNMILDKVEVQQYGPLGLDDMPTGLRLNVTLKHGMPRDRRQIEYMYQSGDFRSYIPMGKHIEYAYLTAEDLTQNIKSSEKHAEATTDPANTPNPDAPYAKIEIDGESLTQDSDSAMVDQIATNNIFMRMFGTNQIFSIIKAAEEAHLGSSVAVSDATAKARAAKAAKAAEEDKKAAEAQNNKKKNK